MYSYNYLAITEDVIILAQNLMKKYNIADWK